MKKFLLIVIFLLGFSSSSAYAFDLLNRERFIGGFSVRGDSSQTDLDDMSELSLFVPYDDFTFSWENQFHSDLTDITLLTTDYTMFIGAGWFRPEAGLGLFHDSSQDYAWAGWTIGWRHHQRGIGARENADIGPSNMINLYSLGESEELRRESKGNLLLGDLFMTAKYWTTGYVGVKAGADIWAFDRMIQVFVDYELRHNGAEVFEEFRMGLMVRVALFYMGAHSQNSDSVLHLGITF